MEERTGDLSMEYSIVIPVYNEADKILSTLNKVLPFMKSFTESYEVLVVDDEVPTIQSS